MTLLPLTADFRQSSVSASWIHKEIRDNEDLSAVIAACRKNPKLIWECNSRSWTTMHVVAISHDTDKWKGLLQEAAKGSDKLCRLQTDVGYTCLDLFFRRALYPFPWQRMRRQVQYQADLLRRCIEKVCSNERELDDLKERIRDARFTGTGTDENSDTVEDASDSAVEIVLRFWKNLQLLLCAIQFDSIECVERDQKQVLQTLSRLHWCPHIVGVLVTRLFPDQLQAESSPLHIWTTTEKRTRVYDIGMLDSLCQAYPEAAQLQDPRSKRLPLQSALAMGMSFSEILPLFEAYPNVLACMDNQSGLPTFCLPAAVGPNSGEEIESVAKRCDPQNLSVWCYISKREKQRIIEQAKDFLDCQQLNTIFELLCRNPSAIKSAHT